MTEAIINLAEHKVRQRIERQIREGEDAWISVCDIIKQVRLARSENFVAVVTRDGRLLRLSKKQFAAAKRARWLLDCDGLIELRPVQAVQS